MLSFFRSLLKSKVGAGIALAMLAIIAVAFASGDIAGFGSSTGLSSGGVATVGSETISGVDLAQGANQALSRVKQQQPSATMKLLVAQGGLEQVLGDLIDRAAFYAFGKESRIVVSERLVDSEIAQIPAFQGVDGKFDQNTFRQALAQQGMSEENLRKTFAQSLSAQQLLAPAQFGTIMPEYAARRYAELLNEVRSGSVVVLPSVLFAPETAPTDAQLAAFYKAHTEQFILPERRVVRYAAFGEEALKNPPAPTDAEIAARYKADTALYAAQDDRKITQLIVPTEAAARAVAAEVAGGKSLETAAKEKGLSAAPLEFFSRQQLSSQFSPEIAEAVFAAPVGKIAAPKKSPLGWHVVRVDEERKTPARPLAEVKDELVKQLTEEKRRKAFSDMLANIEDQFTNGANLVEVAKAIGVEASQTDPLVADGRVYMKPGQTAPDVLKPVLATAFTMEQEEPQVAEVERGKTFVIYDVTNIAASAPAPLAQIKDDVTQAWKIDAGSQAAKAAALRMLDTIRKGKSLEQAMADVGKPLPPVEQVSMSRPTLAAALRAGKQVPPPVSLMFHMAKGTVKVQSAAQERGWFVVLLKDIVPGKVESGELVFGAQKELGQQLGQAYGDALAKAIRKDVGVTRNAAAIKAVRDQLSGAAAN
ncbi:peptidyl-prolyl cis-trans isomerase D [Novosphingobium sp. CF614]|uniref:peptidylprolyl isomerase n=1 Tax=Novosphingobium sp. CF614 TaxID=1884364 RepID=UPI0008F39012|nr:peptidylprolyl isomerase [Novosphingobium sp. CF614]SFG09560.1 peptidyl-prolyl cis-trans isomerase D [Novosphingobium sp. CF614]